MADIKVGETAKKAAGFGKKFFGEFKQFISRGNVIDLSVGVLIGGAFSGLVTAFTDDIINPILGLLGGANAEFGWTIPIGSQRIAIGSFVSSIINFLIMALVIFLIMKALNKLLSLGKKAEEEKPAEPPKPSDEVVLLTEIRDLLKAKDGE